LFEPMTKPLNCQLLRVVAATGLLSRHQRIVDKIPPEVAIEFVHGVSRQRMTGLALAAITDRRFHLGDDALGELLRRHEAQLALDLQLERLLTNAAMVLRDRDIPYRALKGPLLAHTVYRDPALRSFGDIDLLVPSLMFDPATDVLGSLGFVRRFLEPRSGFDARFTKGACLRRSDGFEIDLHRTLAPGAFGVRVARHDFFAAPCQDLVLGAASVAGLNHDLAFVHACFHAALGDHPPRFVPIRDVAECFQLGINEDAVIAFAERMHCGAVLQRAIALVDDVLGVALAGELPTWARRYRLSAFDRWALRSYTTENRSYANQIAASFCALPSLRDRASFAASLAFPTKSYVRAREGTYVNRLGRGVRLLRDGTRQ
jgi:putative nucleotidyltransferase-like protein